MNVLPCGWTWAPLIGLGSTEGNSIVDGPFGSKLKTAHYTPTGVRVIRLGNLGVGQFLDDDTCYISPEHAEDLSKHVAEPGDLLIAALAEPVGRCCRVPDSAGRCIVKADCVRFRPGPMIEPLFVMNWLNSPEGRRRSEEASHGIGRLRINKSEIQELQIPVPPINEQRRIVAKIEELTARSRRAREALEAVPPLLEQLRQSVLAAAFSGRLTADWREKNKDVEPASVLLERIRAERRRRWEENELAKLRAKGKEPKDDRWKAKYIEPVPVDPTGLPELPEGWCWAKLEELSQRITDGTHQAPKCEASGIPFLVIGNVISGYIDWHGVSKWVSEETHRALTAACPPERGDVLYTAVGSFGTAIEVNTDRQFVFQRHIAHIKPVKRVVNTTFLAYWLNSPTSYSQAEKVARGVAQKTVTLGSLREFLLPIPPVQEQEEINRRISILAKQIAAVSATVESLQSDLETMNNAVLAKAFRGELVPQDPNDEPASVLLERIRAERTAAEADNKKRRSSRPSRLRGEKQNRKDAKSAENPTTCDDPFQTVLHFLQTNPGHQSKSDILTHTSLDPTTWPTLAPELANHPNIDRTGEKRGTRYEWKDR